MWWLIFPAAVIIFIAVLLFRAAAFKPKPVPAPDSAPVEVDEKRAAESLRAMIRCRTVSSYDLASIDRAEYDKFHDLLCERYPGVARVCEFERMAGLGLLYRWKGLSSDSPALCMAHYDVVPVVDADWTHPPFSGELIDGVIWGRGALDTKNTLCATLEAAELLINSGFTPKQDIYFAFGADEETGGSIARAMSDELHARSINFAMVLDEGGAIVEGSFPGVTRPTALIGICEKGCVNIHVTADIPGGHSSTPPARSGMAELARLVTAVEDKPFPRRFTKPVREMFDTLGRYSTFVYRLIFANLWCFLPLLDLICKKSGGELNAMMRTTAVFTQAKGSDAPNVMPPAPSMVCNSRIIPGETADSVLLRLRTLAKGLRLELVMQDATDPSPVSDTSADVWQLLSGAIRATFPAAIVSPYLMMGGTDSRSYARFTDRVYRLAIMELSGEERATIHAANERIPVSKLADSVRVMVRILREW